MIHPTAILDEDVLVGEGTKIWHFCHLSRGARIGRGSSLGQNVFLGAGVRVGDHVKIQNNVSIYEGVELDDYVFCGPSCVFTNVVNPRAEVSRRGAYARTKVLRGATIGANATIVCKSGGVTVGRYAFVAAGAVLTSRVVPSYALMVGAPARRVGWMSRHGHRLSAPDRDGLMRCPESGWRYQEVAPELVRCLDRDEEACL